MKRARSPIHRLALLAAAVCLLTGGCGKSSSGPPAGTAATKPTPEQSFEFIMATFKRRIEDTPSGFVNHDGGRSRLMATNKVTSEVFPPAKEGEPYRAQVVVVSETRYSLQRPADDADEPTRSDDQRNNQRIGIGQLDDPGTAGRGTEILDPGLVASSAGGNANSPATADSGPIRRNDKDERKFDLEYKDGKWQLLTAPNPQTERAIELAFEESLSTQI